MSFDLASFDRSGFDTGGEGVVLFSGFAQEKITPVIGTSQELYIQASAYERVNSAGVLGGNGIYIGGSATEEVVTATATGEKSVMFGPVISAEAITAEVEGRSIDAIKPIAAETMAASVNLNAEVGVIGSAREIITGTAYNEKEASLSIIAYELMSASASLEAIDIEVCEINVTLQPGDRLIVDANDYAAWLNNEIALDNVQGEWIDKLTRDTSSISITAASGVANLTASILYTERYL